MTPELLERLRKLAAEEAWSDNEDFCVDDYAAGNEDDAYYGGLRDGGIALAREILKALGEKP